MSASPSTSIVLIFFNEERFLAEAIESVLAQTMTDWELLLVDDGSTDGSRAIAERYAANDSRVRYLQHPDGANRGMSESRNLGLRSSSGEYVCFLDGDDVYLPRKLEDQAAILDAHHEVRAVCGRAEWWFSFDGSHSTASDFLQRYRLRLDDVHRPPTLLIEYLTNEWASPCDMMLRRSLLEAVGGYESRFRGLYEDQVFHAKIALMTPVYVAGANWYRYRQHADATTAKAHAEGNARTGRRTFLEWLRTYVRRASLDDPTARKQLQRVIRKELMKARHPRPVRAMEYAYNTARFGHARLRGLVGLDRRILPVGGVRFGNLRRTRPISAVFGSERGLPVDRYYVERFLLTWSACIRGHVLEIGNDTYTRKFGGDQVERVDILNVNPGDPKTTIVADLASAPAIPTNRFDCIVLTQTLHLIYDVPAALRTLHRILKPGGVLLATFPGLSQTSDPDWRETWYWGFTKRVAERLFAEAFGEGALEIDAYGNVLTSAAFLYGLATHELRPHELDDHDPHYEMLISAKAVKAK